MCRLIVIVIMVFFASSISFCYSIGNKQLIKKNHSLEFHYKINNSAPNDYFVIYIIDKTNKIIYSDEIECADGWKVYSMFPFQFDFNNISGYRIETDNGLMNYKYEPTYITGIPMGARCSKVGIKDIKNDTAFLLKSYTALFPFYNKPIVVECNDGAISGFAAYIDGDVNKFKNILNSTLNIGGDGIWIKDKYVVVLFDNNIFMIMHYANGKITQYNAYRILYLRIYEVLMDLKKLQQETDDLNRRYYERMRLIYKNLL